MFWNCTYLYGCKMRTMKKYLYLLLAVASLLPLASCSKRVEKLQQQVRLEGIESVRLEGLTTLCLDLRVVNDSPYKLQLSDAEAHLYYRDYKIASMLLTEVVEVAKRSGSATYPTHWRVEVGNPMTLLPLLGKVREGDVSECWVQLEIEGRGGPVPINLSRQKMPLSDFLRTFGVQTEDLKNFLN